MQGNRRTMDRALRAVVGCSGRSARSTGNHQKRPIGAWSKHQPMLR
jgi:hypothetical protein